jgi:hypothetical protein
MTAGHKNPDSYLDGLIAENKRARSTFLDLGNLGMTEVPEEVFYSRNFVIFGII